jgi:hypothetical protein
MEGIEFTDRYDGNPPAWLTSCHECEAMGCSPEPCPATAGLWGCPRPGEHREPGFDGWHFMLCASCRGTARVPWYVAVARIPRWIWKGLRFFDHMARPRYRAPHMTQGQHLLLVFNCAFTYELAKISRDIVSRILRG